MRDGEEVRLTMPATPPLLRVARLTAAGLASRLGFDLNEVEDLKIAVDELCHAIVGPQGRDGSLTLVYRLHADALVIEGVSDFPAVPAGTVTTELSSLILAAVVDEHEISHLDSTIRFRLTKRAKRP
ncbi:MAG: anti-sigma regulatory factor [Acidimicrobiales bacterium]